MSSDDLARHIRALAKQPGTFRESSLPQPKERPPAAGSIGIGRSGGSSATTATATVFTEIALVYTEVLVQEAGVFELPRGWPDDNTYAGVSFADSELPVIGDPYVVQRRVHAYVMQDANKRSMSYTLLTSYAKPFASDNTAMTPPFDIQGFQPVVKSFLAAGASSDAQVQTMLDTYGV